MNFRRYGLLSLLFCLPLVAQDKPTFKPPVISVENRLKIKDLQITLGDAQIAAMDAEKRFVAAQKTIQDSVTELQALVEKVRGDCKGCTLDLKTLVWQAPPPAPEPPLVKP